MAVERKSRPSLKACLLGFVVVTGVLSTATLVLLGERRLREFEMSVLAQIAERRGNAAAEVFARALWTDWRDVSTLAAQTSPNEIASAGPMLDLIVGDGERISWAGIAALDGTVVAASKHMLEGASVAERPWFIAGLDGPFAGDVHEAKLLAKLLPAVSGEPLRFLDLSAPIQTTDGRAVGVVGFHLNHAWAVDYLAETARFVGVDAVIVNRSGEVVVGPKDLVGERFSIASIGAAGVGTGAARVETWPDGTPSMTVVIPALTHRDLPSFGWSLVGRVDPNTLAPARLGFSRAITAQIAALGLTLLAATVFFIRLYVRPMSQLAEDASRIAAGENLHPIESRLTSEVADLSEAIVRLQTHRDRRRAGSAA
jgi:hypothetical protein